MASLTTSYYTLDGEIIGESTGGVRVDYQVDALGSVTGHIDQTGVAINKARYKPYGTLLSGTQYTVGWCGTLGYRTKSTVKSSDVYVRARSYGTKFGQWGTRDPLWPSELPYGYVVGNPASLYDKSGVGPIRCNKANSDAIFTFCTKCYQKPNSSCVSMCNTFANLYYAACHKPGGPHGGTWAPVTGVGVVPLGGSGGGSRSGGAGGGGSSTGFGGKCRPVDADAMFDGPDISGPALLGVGAATVALAGMTCEAAERHKDQACTDYSCASRSMTDCTDLLDHYLRGRNCVAARIMVTDLCYGGVWDDRHWPPAIAALDATLTCYLKIKHHDPPCGFRMP